MPAGHSKKSKWIGAFLREVCDIHVPYDVPPSVRPKAKVGHNIGFDLKGKQIVVAPYCIEYKSKFDYVRYEWSDIKNKHSEAYVAKKVIALCENVRIMEPGRVGDVGWDVKYICDPKEFTPRPRAYININSFGQMKKMLFTGMMGLKASPGDVIASRPTGYKWDMGQTPESEKVGSDQRSVLSKKYFGFGDVKEDGMQYAYYDENYELQPI